MSKKQEQAELKGRPWKLCHCPSRVQLLQSHVYVFHPFLFTISFYLKLSIPLALLCHVSCVEHRTVHKTSPVETKGYFRDVSRKHPKSGGKMLFSRDICMYRALLLLAVHNYRQLCFVFDGERKRPAEVEATHQPSPVNTQKGGLGRSLLLLHGSPAAQEHKTDTKMGSAVTRPGLLEPRMICYKTGGNVYFCTAGFPKSMVFLWLTSPLLSLPCSWSCQRSAPLPGKHEHSPAKTCIIHVPSDNAWKS